MDGKKVIQKNNGIKFEFSGKDVDAHIQCIIECIKAGYKLEEDSTPEVMKFKKD